ncbi:hypothetical protein NDU88_002529, partial [Pleurodeles waltl]
SAMASFSLLHRFSVWSPWISSKREMTSCGFRTLSVKRGFMSVLSQKKRLEWTMASSHRSNKLLFLSSPKMQGLCCTPPFPAVKVSFTAKHYGVQRLPFSEVTDQDLEFFSQLLPGRVVTDPDLLKPFNVDWLKSVQ